LPQDDDFFVAVDESCRVAGLEDVYAAGDITTFPVKQGGLAAQQADVAASVIAAAAGAKVAPEPFEPVLRGLLLSSSPLFLRTELGGGHGEVSTADSDALWCRPRRSLPATSPRTWRSVPALPTARAAGPCQSSRRPWASA
jgi:sulfide:quinone oxidoreductase